jgi:hypothetical protein
MGAEVTNTQERTTTSHALPHVDNADERAQRGPALHKSQVHGSQQAEADLEGPNPNPNPNQLKQFVGYFWLKMLAARWRPSRARKTKRMRPARSSDSSPGLAMAYSRRCRFAVTYTEGVHHKNTVSKSSKGCHLSFCKLATY